MPHLVYLGLPAPGHVNPSLPVVAELVRRGERVVYYDSEDFRDAITRAGAEFRPYPLPMPSPAEIGRLLEAGDLTRVALLLLERTSDMLDALGDTLRRDPPSLLMFDSNALWGGALARALRVPSVAFVISLVPEPGGRLTLRERLVLMGQGLRVLPRFVAARRRLLRRHGPGVFGARGIFPALGDRNLLFTCPEMQPPTPLLDDTFRLVGTSVDERDAEAPLPCEVQDPLVYVAVGTLMAGPRFLRAAVHALRASRGTVLMSTGHAAPEELGALPPQFVVRPRVPQLAVLRRAALFVTHGGMNSVHEALLHGVPMVVGAHNAEWAYIGRRVEACGAGLVLGAQAPYGRFTAEELEAATARVLREPSFRECAARLSASLRAAGGARRAADEVLALLGK